MDNKAEQKVFYREDGSKIGILTYKEGCPFNGIFIEIEERMGISITGQYKNGRKIKTWKAVQQDTLLWQKKYKAGFRTGKWYKYNQKTCTKTFVHFKNNKMNGWYTEYTTKKLSWAKKRYILRSFFRKLPWVAITKGKYKDDKKTGKWVYRDREGNIIRTEFWNYGVLKQ
ncbi:MAG: hypothetical protein C0594_15145 [Marinilabiliales bacterium]|nr:MAG: hypothetical protein C0594_15145 [Marinilabiliales bacterium]